MIKPDASALIDELEYAILGAAHTGNFNRVDDAKAAIRKALAPAPTPVWKPFDTAPIEGDFLVFMPDERTKIQVARFHPNVRIIGNVFDFDLTQPTHWMDLPALPTTWARG